MDGLHVSPAATSMEALHKAGVLEGGPPSSQALLEFRALTMNRGVTPEIF